MRIIKDFIIGIKYIFRGTAYFLKNRDFWKFVLIPFIVNLCILAVFITFLARYMPEITDYLRVRIGLEYQELSNTAWYAKGWVWVLNLLVTFIKIILGIIIVVVTGILFFILSQIIVSPFYDALSEKIEKKYSKKICVEVSIWKALRDIPGIVFTEIKKMLFLICVPLVLLVLNLIPMLGNIAYVVMAALFTSVLYASNYVDYIQAYRMVPFAGRVKFAKKNFFMLAGFGLFVFVPFLNLLVNPFMVTGGTLIYLDKTGEKTVRP